LTSKIREMLIKHIKNNSSTYFFLFIAFVIGVSAGAFTVNGLSAAQNEELSNYFQGFLQLLDSQKIDSNELLKVSFMENLRLVTVLWVLGVTIIGIPFIYILVGIRGFITGFTSGFVIKVVGLKGILFTILGLLPKEIIIVPCVIALGVSGVNFSLAIIRKKSNKRHLKENLKSNFFAYCMVTLLLLGIIFIGVSVEAYITPVFIRMMAPIISL
jgi:stage II sporulation protein M